jgi:DNA-binding CsgD family transcriptional regulator
MRSLTAVTDTLRTPHDLECLSEGQRECLRLVMLHLSSKEIARTLGISPHTVDQRLRVAVRNLGVSSRFEAARLLAMHGDAEAADPYQPLIYQRPELPDAPANQQPPVYTATGSADASEADRMLELNATTAVFPLPHLERQRGLKWPVPTVTGDDVNDLSPAERLLAVILIALGSLMAFGTFLSGLDALSRLI